MKQPPQKAQGSHPTQARQATGQEAGGQGLAGRAERPQDMAFRGSGAPKGRVGLQNLKHTLTSLFSGALRGLGIVLSVLYKLYTGVRAV